MSDRPPTVLQLHLTDLRRRYLEASRRGRVALRAHDLDGFELANRQKQEIREEWNSVVEGFFRHHVRLGRRKTI